MKRLNTFMAALAALSVFVSCEEPEPEKKVEPVFPTKIVNNSVKPGEELVLTFTPNMDWEISVPEDNLQWFWINNSGFSDYKVSGKASEIEVSVIIEVSSQEEFDTNRSCNVTLTMGGESEVIAEYMRPAKDRTLKAFSAVVENGALKYAEDGSGIIYDTQEAEAFELLWSEHENGYVIPVMVESNYEWTVSFPEWALGNIPEQRTGTSRFNIFSVSSELPMEDSESVVRFMAGEDVVKEYIVRIPGSKDVFSYSLNGYTSLEFDYAGYYKDNNDSYLNEPVSGWLFGPEKAGVLVAEMKDGVYTVVENSSWVELEVSEYDMSDGADVLQTRTLTLSVSQNSGNDRKAVVFFLPATMIDNKDLLFTDDGTGVKDEYRKYAVLLSQAQLPDNYLTPDEDAKVLEEAGVIFSKSSDSTLYSEFGDSPYAYELTYTKSYSREKAYMRLTVPFAGYSVYDENRNEITDEKVLAKHWLGFTLLSGDNYGAVDMFADKIDAERAEGYIVFKDSKGQVLAVVHCTYVAEVESEVDVIEDMSDLFIDKDSAMAAGATLVEVTSGPTYDSYKEFQAPVRVLTYSKPDTCLEIKVPETSINFTVNPWSKVRLVSVDGKFCDEGGELLEWDDTVNSYVGTFDGTVEIAMQLLDGAASGADSAVTLFYNKNNQVVLTLVCNIDIE